MNPETSGDMIDAAAYSVEELREAVFEGRGRVARPLALALLARKQYPQKVADLQTVVTNEQEQPRLRALAASELGRIHAPDAVRALERALQTRDGVTVRAAAKALAQVGTDKHLRSLQKLATSPGAVGRDAQRALGVLSSRVGGGRATRAAPPPQTVPVQATGKPTAITIAPATAADIASAIKTLPAGKLARRGAVSFDCQGRKLVFVFDEPSLGKDVGMFGQRGEVGIVAEPPGVEGLTWSARYRVSVEPAAKGAFRVDVTTQDGRAVLTGTGRTDAGAATFELAAVDTPGALPVEIRGRFSRGKLTFEQARSGVRRRPKRVAAQDVAKP